MFVVHQFDPLPTHCPVKFEKVTDLELEPPVPRDEGHSSGCGTSMVVQTSSQ
jgi:hypothetical protein